MPTTYDSVTGQPSYTMPGADEGAAQRTAEQEERLEAILARIEERLTELQASIQAAYDKAAAGLADFKAAVDARLDELVKAD